MKISFPIRISLIYMSIGALWILLSDDIVNTMSEDPHVISKIQTYKGWFFILITGWLLFELARREFSRRNRLMRELEISKNKAEEADRLKTAFLANVSHEIRTPMNSILGFSELMTDSESSVEEKAHYSTLIQEKGNELLRMIDDIVEISKIQEGQISLCFNQINLLTLLDEITYTLHSSPEFIEKKEAITFNVQFELEAMRDIVFISDVLRIKQILYNLLINAFRFTREGAVTLIVEKQGEGVLFRIKDTGVGIPKSEQQKIFLRFQQANNSLSGIPKGTGLGLAICKGFVELLGGKIELQSEPEIGSEFSVYIPSHKEKS
ncbi:MAG: ATP-binding protein [Bacteroidota bacterium]|nr:ATP-binding protein [Bacteroidota bacterium]MDP4206917.1 ATP-binding protein [Bacteroidota bacterium]